MEETTIYLPKENFKIAFKKHLFFPGVKSYSLMNRVALYQGGNWLA